MHKVETGDRVLMKKAHPCGGYEWLITRVGADVGMRCTTCERQVMLARGEFQKRLKKIVEKTTQASTIRKS
ncbi:MAG: DUF951 domain-containing protein [Anaerolineae bacterium]|nr:DUF951 domain-containing protein [Anaerolineae bacterium]MBN8619605.1 DUF951 domain-containing protein [Anaerolineae bacterium]